jgi:hypothetical protein
MSDLCGLIWSAVAGPFRSRAALQIEIVLLRHQLNVLRRRSPKRVNLNDIDRLVFSGIYRQTPQVMVAPQILKPETVICWHRRFPSLLVLEITAVRWPAEDAT